MIGSATDKRWSSTFAVPVLTCLLGAWLISPRFEIGGPSLIDDWASMQRAPAAFKAVAQLRYIGGSPPGVDNPARYRPGFTAIWNSLEWHTFGAPTTLTAPNAWNILRLSGFVMALAALAMALSHVAAPRGPPPRSLSLAVLSGMAPALVLATPGIPVDFARFGPQEPLLVAGMAGGALLIALAVARSASGLPARGAAVALPAIAGYALWLLGVYSKEVSVAAVALVPFALMEARRSGREDGLAKSPWRLPQVRLAAALMTLPLVHVAAVSIRIANRGTTAYGTKPASSPQAFWSAFESQWTHMSQALGTPMWNLLAMALPLLVLASWFVRRRFPWLAAGVTAVGFVVLLYQGLSGVDLVSRYYIPALALFAVAAVVLATDLPPFGRWLLAVLAVGYVALNASPARDRVVAWVAGEQADQRLVAAVSPLQPSRCRVYAGPLDLERAVALPVVAGLREPSGPCRLGATTVLVQLSPAHRVQGFPAPGCRAPGWRLVNQGSTFAVFSCRQLTRRVSAQLESSDMRVR